jgi:signal transduction histidine kinase
VNDVPDQLRLMSVIMQQAGYTVWEATNGIEAFEVARRLKPMVIISDVCMPRASGIELTRRLRASEELGDIPVLLVSAIRREEEDAIEGLLAGADDYIETPCDPMRLVAKVARLVERGRTEEALKSSEQEKAKALDALRQSEEQLLQSQRLEAVGQLAGGIAHDFNNLLTVITGYSGMELKAMAADDPSRPRIQEISNAADRAASLTRQLLAFSRKQVLQPKVFDLNSVVPEMEKMLKRMIGENIKLSTTLEPNLGNVKADPGQMEQVIMNLVVNSRDAMPSGGQLTIETANVHLDEAFARNHVAVVPGDYVLLAVSDTGTGMDEETQRHVFEPFFTTKAVDKGTGLGMSTVYGIVKQSGGSIWVYSKIGEGTTVKIYLPRVSERAEELKPALTAEDIPQGTETILLVEDARMVRNLAIEILMGNGYQVLEATNGREALRVSEQSQGPIHLLLTDVVMPGMSGRELANRLVALHPEMRVLYMSGYTEDTIVHHGVLEEGINFIPKPFSPDALALKVREVIDADLSG